MSDELLPDPGPLGGMLATARRLGRASSHPPFRQDLLYGPRAIKRPLMAVATKKELGNCRHALSQMVVAGVMTVHPPMRPGATPAAAPDNGPRVLTFTPPPPKDLDPAAAPPPAAPPPRALPTPNLAPPKPGAPNLGTQRVTASVPQKRPPTPPRPAPATDRSGRTVTVERKIVEDFNPFPTREDE